MSFVSSQEEHQASKASSSLLSFNLLLRAAGLEPADVRLVRHQDQRATKRRTPYRLWRDDRNAFEQYQATQSPTSRGHLAAEHWAVFVATPDQETLFVGLYKAHYRGVGEVERADPHRDQIRLPGSYDLWELHHTTELSDYEGKLFIVWGRGYRKWVQRADRQDKPISELRRTLFDPPFPGFAHFVKQLSEIETLPPTWASALAASRGIYLLTCPRTKEQYVGAAYGERGFLGRWLEYAANGHGGNVALKSRDPSDYRVSILEVASSSATSNDILVLESLWKAKLQSVAMGLNRNGRRLTHRLLR